MAQHKPIVCTLNFAGRLARGISWRDVMRRYARGVTERDDGYVLKLVLEGRELAALEELVESERACCDWMDLNLELGSGTTLTITSTSHGGKTAIAKMLGLGAEMAKQ